MKLVWRRLLSVATAVSVCFAVVVGTGSAAQAADIAQTGTITETPPVFEGLFGMNIAGDGSTVVVGAQGTGAAYVYDVANEAASNPRKLVPSGRVAGDRTGASVGISGDVIAIAAPFRPYPSAACVNGAVDLYRRDGSGAWNQWATVNPPPVGYPCQAFAGHIRFGGSLMAVNAGSYSIDTYDLSGGAPTLADTLYYIDRPSNSIWEVNWDLSPDGRLLAVVGSDGCIYLYDRTGSGWARRSGCTPLPVTVSPVASRLALSNSTLAIGFANTTTPPAVWLYSVASSAPTLIRQIMNPDSTTPGVSRFGQEGMLLTDSELFVVARDQAPAGKIYHFNLSDGSLLDRFSPTNVPTSLLAGGGIAIAGSTLFAGNPSVTLGVSGHWEGTVVSWPFTSIPADNTPPSVMGTPDRPAQAGWYRAPVTVTWTAVDPQPSSGLETLPPPTTVSTEGASQAISSPPVCDLAGNCATGMVPFSIDLTPPTISSSLSASPTSAGWFNQPVTVMFSCADALSGIATCPGPISAAEGDPNVATGTASDVAGNQTALSVHGLDVDTTPPVLTGTPMTPPNASGWYQGDVTIAWACNDARSGINGPCPPNAVIQGEGSGLNAAADVTDRAGNRTHALSATVQIDRTPPDTTANANENWSSASVAVVLTPTDNLSGVAATTYQIDNGPTVTGTTAQVTGSGVHTIKYSSTDRAGNAEPAKTATVKIDTTTPTIDHQLSPPPNTAGWNNTPVTATFTCTSALSGIATCSSPVLVSNEGKDLAVLGQAVSNAGTSATDTALVSLDRTPPNIAGAPTTAPINGWFNSPVTVRYTCQDALAGIASCADDITLPNDGAGQSVTGTATDAAGNTAATTVSSINIDRTPPSIQPNASAQPTAGWYHSPVTFHFTCQDALSGVASCPPDQTISTDGVGRSITVTATDRAGNTTTTTISVNLDQTAPTVAVTGVTTGATYDLGSVPTVACTTIDQAGGSGVAVAATPATTRAPNGTYTTVCSGASDIAGNTASPVTVSYTVSVVTTTGANGLKALIRSFTTNNGVISSLGAHIDNRRWCQFIKLVIDDYNRSIFTTTQRDELLYWASTQSGAC